MSCYIQYVSFLMNWLFCQVTRLRSKMESRLSIFYMLWYFGSESFFTCLRGLSLFSMRQPQGEHANWNELASETFETAEECLNTNYYGAKRMVEALVPLLQLSDSPRIVNVSSLLGLLKVKEATCRFNICY